MLSRFFAFRQRKDLKNEHHNMSSQSYYIDGLDALRGIAATLVAVYHFKMFSLVNTDVGLFYGFVSNGHLWVDFFFVLSGFVLTHVYRENFVGGMRGGTYRAFLGARLARIYPLHLFLLFILIAWEALKLYASVMLGASMENPPFSGRTAPETILSNLLLIHAWNVHDDVSWNHVSWSISAEWAAYLVAPVLIVTIDRFRSAVLIGLMILCVAGLYGLTLIVPNEMHITYDYGVVRCLCGFLIGIALYQFYRRGLPRIFESDATFMTGLALAVIPMALNWHDVLAIPGMAATVLTGAANRGRIARLLTLHPMVMLGALSYSIYLVHPVIQQVVRQSWAFLFGETFGASFTAAESAASMLLLLAVTFVSASILYRLVEVPGRRLLRAWLMAGRRRGDEPPYPGKGATVATADRRSS